VERTSNEKTMIRKIIIAGLIALSFAIPAEADECSSCLIYKGYISGDMGLWEKGMAQMREAYGGKPLPCLLFTFTEARYGYIGYMLGMEKRSEVKPLVNAFEADIESLAAYAEYRAETEAFRVALLGFRMGLNPALAVFLGPKALKQLEKALATGRTSATVWIEKANAEAYMPAFAGGSKAKAAESFRKALSLYEADSSLSACNWRYLNTMVLLGQTLEKMDDYPGAREAYLKALQREPEFRWVRDELLPAVEKKLKQQED
jgi:tetratricopeptide (TPR) repeat protein